jgi:steroid 5-alpha reductase family enzyme
MEWINAYLAGGAFILVLVLLIWLVSLTTHDAGIIDMYWGAGFAMAAWTYLSFSPGEFTARRLLVALLVTAWGLRLSGYIYLRNRGKPEDFRYAAWRKQHGQSWWWKSLFQVFLLQGLLLWIISIPLLLVQAQPAGPSDLGWLDALAIVVWGAGFYFEAAGDWQLVRFKNNPKNKGKLLSSGVWRYTRHPNYFGDAAQWWGFYLLAVAAGGWWTLYAPAIMTFLLVRVSGVALLEKTLSNRPGYREYIETTSAFFPWPPRSVAVKHKKLH